jgi:hypothetical protein
MLCGGLTEAFADSVDSLLLDLIISIPRNLGRVMVAVGALIVEFVFERS